MERLSASWANLDADKSEDILCETLAVDQRHELDPFDRVQLAHVIQVCRDSRSMSEAGRQLFGASRVRKTSTNDADRLRKYLSRFGIDWEQIVRLES